jgi:prevent-host-death family protein
MESRIASIDDIPGEGCSDRTRLVSAEMAVKRPTSRKAARKQQPAPKEWQLQDAKARFSEVFRLARERGPQRFTKHGRGAVVIIPAEEYARMTRVRTGQHCSVLCRIASAWIRHRSRSTAGFRQSRRPVNGFLLDTSVISER